MPLTLTPKIEKAFRKAAILHGQQMRKGEKDIPYITHPFAAAFILSRFVSDENVIIAAILHDTIEDTHYTLSELEREFGKTVATIIQHVSEEYVLEEKELSWQERKEYYLYNLRQGPDESFLVAAADKIHNLTTLLYDYEIHGELLWENFYGDTRERIWFFEAVLGVLRERLDHPLIEEYEHLLREAKKYFLSAPH